MTVYVDDARLSAPHLLGGRGKWSHLTADTKEELHAFAERLGLKRSWFQDHPRLWHYDVVDRNRKRAIALGAQSVSVYDLVRAAMARSRGDDNGD